MQRGNLLTYSNDSSSDWVTCIIVVCSLFYLVNCILTDVVRGHVIFVDGKRLSTVIALGLRRYVHLATKWVEV